MNQQEAQELRDNQIANSFMDWFEDFFNAYMRRCGVNVEGGDEIDAVNYTQRRAELTRRLLQLME